MIPGQGGKMVLLAPWSAMVFPGFAHWGLDLDGFLLIGSEVGCGWTGYLV